MMRSNRVILVASVILIVFAVVGGALSAAPNPGWPAALSWIPLDPGPVAGLSLFGLLFLQLLGYVLRRRPTIRPTGADPVAAATQAVALHRRLAALHPSSEVPNLARSLVSLAAALVAAQRGPEALTAIEEALTLARPLAAQEPARYGDLLVAAERLRAQLPDRLL
jgi:hypothetical protein